MLLPLSVSAPQGQTMNYDTANVMKTHVYVVYVVRKTPVRLLWLRKDWISRTGFFSASAELCCATLENVFTLAAPVMVRKPRFQVGSRNPYLWNQRGSEAPLLIYNQRNSLDSVLTLLDIQSRPSKLRTITPRRPWYLCIMSSSVSTSASTGFHC